MEKRKVLIIDSSESICQALEDTLRGAYWVRSCTEGSEALEMLNTYRADILILDLMLTGLDGITLLQRLGQTQLRPMVLATTRYVSSYILDAAERLGVSYLMMKPCSTEAIAARVADMTQRMKMPVFSAPDPKTQVSNMLLSLRFSTKLRGYTYLREAVLLMAQDRNMSITKELYPEVAVRCNATTEQVERSIRGAIQQAWERGDRVSWQLVLGGEASRPSNGVLITCLADRLLLAQNETPDWEVACG